MKVWEPGSENPVHQPTAHCVLAGAKTGTKSPQDIDVLFPYFTELLHWRTMSKEGKMVSVFFALS